jgi:hypothetical protein
MEGEFKMKNFVKEVMLKENSQNSDGKDDRGHSNFWIRRWLRGPNRT